MGGRLLRINKMHNTVKIKKINRGYHDKEIHPLYLSQAP